jgi:quercetin dioxygenase-like cupin family protein
MIKLDVEFVRKDDRGELIQVSTGEWKQANILHIKKGKKLGGHYHKEHSELFYVIDGRIRFTGRLTAIQLKTGDSLFIQPYDKHTFYALKNSTVLELLTRPYDKGDTYV